MCALACAIFFLQGAVGVRSAHADPATSDALTQEGLELRHAGRDAEALAVFSRALALDSSPRTLAQVALAEEALGFWVEAERDLTDALAHAEGDWFTVHHVALQSALETIRSHLATIDVAANVPGAELRVNGSPAGSLPLASPVRVVAGAVAIEVRAPGYRPVLRRITVPVGSPAHEEVTLDKEPNGEPKLEPGRAAGAPPPVSFAVSPYMPLPPAHRPRTTLRTLGWISVGYSGAFLAGGLTALFVRNADAATYNDDARCYWGGLTRDQRCGVYRENAMAAQVVTVIGLSAAGALAATATGLLIFGTGPSPAKTALRCGVGAGLTCGVAF
jgi:hypothetical protein